MVGLMKKLRFVEVMPALMLSVCLVACGGEDDAECEVAVPRSAELGVEREDTVPEGGGEGAEGDRGPGVDVVEGREGGALGV